MAETVFYNKLYKSLHFPLNPELSYYANQIGRIIKEKQGS